MRALVLCPGPSLKLFADEALQAVGPWDAVIGVNRVPGSRRCDYWCFGDRVVFEQVERPKHGRDGRPPTIFAVGHVIDELRRTAPGGSVADGFMSAEALAERAHRFSRHEVLAWDPIRTQFHPPSDPGSGHGWDSYSGPAAITLAAVLGIGAKEGTEIVVLGADMVGELDFEAKKQAHRNETRWRIERRIVQRVVEWCAKQGAKVTIHASAEADSSLRERPCAEVAA